MSKNSAVDEYIQNAAPFAQPLLTKIRKLVHRACPDATETIKWGFPNFVFGDGILCSMAAFKNHCAFSFWKASLLKDDQRILKVKDKNSMGNLDKLHVIGDLPADKILIAYLKEAALLNENNIKPKSKARRSVAVPLNIPDYFSQALKKNKQAVVQFNQLSTSHQNEYIEWVAEAKTEPTRNKRLAQTIEWLQEAKSRNWQYQKTR
jgi:uncharacterized protein YdeI (YjbR/CyaY-like superfamily)